VARWFIDIVLHPDYSKMVGYTLATLLQKEVLVEHKIIRAKLENEALTTLNRSINAVPILLKDNIWFPDF
jgi:hypothetical protein